MIGSERGRMTRYLVVLAAFVIVSTASQARAQDVMVEPANGPLAGTDAGSAIHGPGTVPRTEVEHSDVVVPGRRAAAADSQVGAARFGIMGSAAQNIEMGQSLRRLSMPGSAR